MSHQLLVLFVVTAFSLIACGQRQNSHTDEVILQERVLPRANLTNYEFDASVDDIRSAIKKAYGNDWFLAEAKKNDERVWGGGGDAKTKRALTMQLKLPPGSVFFKGDADALSKGLLTKQGNENDAFFYATDSPVGESKVYFKSGQPLIYYADFHIHLKAVGPKKTRVEIITYDSSVVAGLDESWSPHGSSLISVKVEPTTVEEYEIILRIGKQLGTKDMPSLVIPPPDSPVKELTLPRER